MADIAPLPIPSGKALVVSWEFWANAIAMVLAYLSLDTPGGWAWVPPKYAELIPIAQGLVTILLRWLKTSQPITGIFTPAA